MENSFIRSAGNSFVVKQEHSSPVKLHQVFKAPPKSSKAVNSIRIPQFAENPRPRSQINSRNQLKKETLKPSKSPLPNSQNRSFTQTPEMYTTYSSNIIKPNLRPSLRNNWYSKAYYHVGLDIATKKLEPRRNKTQTPQKDSFGNPYSKEDLEQESPETSAVGRDLERPQTSLSGERSFYAPFPPGKVLKVSGAKKLLSVPKNTRSRLHKVPDPTDFLTIQEFSARKNTKSAKRNFKLYPNKKFLSPKPSKPKRTLRKQNKPSESPDKVLPQPIITFKKNKSIEDNN